MSANPLARAQQVFLAGNQLPARWAGRQRFVVLETGFGLGHNFLATWAAWRQDGQRGGQLHYLAVSSQPPQRAGLLQAHAASPLGALAATLAAQWPALTPDLHLITLDGGQVRLLLAVGEMAQVLPGLVASADAIYLDSFAPACPARQPGGQAPPAWDIHALRLFKRLAAPAATLATWCTHSAVQDGLRSAGFTLQQTTSAGAAAAITVGQFAPRFSAPAPPGRRPLDGFTTLDPRLSRVAVIGAGLAGAAVARALAAQGINVQVFERQPGCAQETSGNAGGLFHGIVHGHDGHHARWLRAAALHTQQVLQPLLHCSAGVAPATTPVAGALHGLLRGEHTLDPAQMQALVQRLGLPADFVQVQANALPGGQPAWLYPGGGWVAPAALCRAWLAHPAISTRYRTPVHQLQPSAAGWRLLGAGGQALATVDAVLLCSASETSRLLGQPAWPLQRQRGQTTVLPAGTPGLPALPLPLADGAYALRLADGALLCGGSTPDTAETTANPDRADNADPTNRAPGTDHAASPGGTRLRLADHLHHLAGLRRLTGWAGTVDTATLGGRVDWRLQADDRLPLIGPVPAPGHPASAAGLRSTHLRLDQPRFAPRIAGLYVFTALGSRGITQAALGGEVLACWLTGAPMPLASSLLDALDPARFAARAARAAQLGVPPG